MPRKGYTPCRATCERKICDEKNVQIPEYRPPIAKITNQNDNYPRNSVSSYEIE